MITGSVNARREPIVSQRVRSPQGQDQDLAAVIDTGFTGHLTLPPAVVAALGLPWRGRGDVILGDGSMVSCNIYEATLIWDGVARTVMVEAADSPPLVGMRLLDGYKLTLDASIGGAVTIEAIP